MNYNDNKKDKQRNNEDFNIKSHLNESLDLSGVTVSEELINKTLNAIKSQASQVENNIEIENDKRQNDKRQNGNKINKLVLWNGYVRRFAGAAAVVLVVFAGFSMMNLIGKSGKKDSMEPQYSQDSATMENKQSNQTSSNSQNEAGTSDVLPENNVTGAAKEYASKTDASQKDASQADASKADNSQTDASQVEASKKVVMDTFTASKEDSSISAKKSSQTTSGATAKKSTGDDETAQIATGSLPSVKSTVKGSKKEAIKEQKSLTESVKTDQQMAENAMPKTSADTKEESDATAESVPKMALRGTITDGNLKFINICPLAPEEISSIKISFIASGTSISITSLSDINDFSTRMEKYQFTQATEDVDSGVYMIEIESPTATPGRYTITVGNNVTVRYTIEEQVTENKYQITDMEGLKNELNQVVTRNGK